MTTTTITKTVFFNASNEVVWEFLTDKEKLGQWFHPAEETLSDGKDYALSGQNHDGSSNKICWGTVNSWNPYTELGYSFTVGPLGGHMTQVNWLLEPVGQGTRLTLTHSGLQCEGETFGIVCALDKGWDEHFAKLRKTASL